MIFKLETERFYLREMVPADGLSIYKLNLDNEVIQYTGDVPFSSPEAASDFLKNYTAYTDFGVGRWAVCEKNTNRFLGWCGIKFHPDKKEYDLGYRFFKQEWDKGIATETSLACLDYVFNELEIEKVYSQAMKVNAASINVMKKLGMTFQRDEECDAESGVVYELTKQEFEAIKNS